MRVFLIGFMGCGKTTLAKKLSARLGYRLVDLDHEIENKLGQSVASFFADHGEDAFRKLESEMLKTLNYDQNTIIATGGGTPCFFDNMDWMNANGHTIYIEMPAPALATRLQGGKSTRPLLKDLNQEQIQEYIEQKLSERKVHYLKAKSVVNGINLGADDLKALIFSNDKN
ncbi:shikimate kinase [Pedobacter immunditicola]|uniref:shikimate kinase n=1 Tax=Pedobacter immunditicola TaxID=3133440 RepID=UPI0030A4914B